MQRINVRLFAGWKCVRTLSHIVTGLFTVVFVFPKLSSQQKEERIKAWALVLLARLAIKLIVVGKPPVHGPVLLAANHISWLDIVVMHAARHCRFVSKADVRHWPLIGTLATGAGTLFIERDSRRDALRVVHHMAERLHAGDILAIFPEGTTSNGVDLLPFHANLFQAAIAANVPVLPVALRFADAASGAHSLAPCYIDHDTLLGSIWRTLTAPPLCAVVTFGEPEFFQGRDRRAWAADVRNTIAALRLAA
ncbi:MAG: 1-acyl-sn-glycerol-3-phosphate acyltransferase [Rhodoferax sp.]|uniref:lysophospholipid acyltransferase family protein n=1 Tax=Rhodoferax sp. TaxID=50421 RepID=UPI001846B814|nr:lysophospholipid acyltransferase family protein [Rhodoferax sp.]NMM21591.1 1-acyl-sn-glycerol-3-phosphate acyltransferase [Rhodoferax sp.]